MDENITVNLCQQTNSIKHLFLLQTITSNACYIIHIIHPRCFCLVTYAWLTWSWIVYLTLDVACKKCSELTFSLFLEERERCGHWHVWPTEDGPLLMDEFGHSRIYEMFLANVRYTGHQEKYIHYCGQGLGMLQQTRPLATFTSVSEYCWIINNQYSHGISCSYTFTCSTYR